MIDYACIYNHDHVNCFYTLDGNVNVIIMPDITFYILDGNVDVIIMPDITFYILDGNVDVIVMPDITFLYFRW